ncbi:hypothetical protein [Ectopseudomonas khazarica]|uniref:hypothetical protein n=1 Tax=Ectopseudomonas khazarica TaxID=2502979 RepID=UPI003A8FBF5F
MTGSADTAGTYAVGTVFGYAETLQRALGTTFGDTVRTDAIGAIFSDAETLQRALGTAFGDTVRANTIGAIFGYAETLQRALGAAFGDTVRANTIGTIFSDDRGGELLDGCLRQGEGTGGQGGEDKAGEDLLFHVRSPEKG